jgi:long-chain acyl-CoA synthetase
MTSVTAEFEFGFWPYARENPTSPALIAPDGAEWNCAKVLSDCNRLAHGLRSHGLMRGDVVALAMPNCAEWIVVALASMQIGLYLLPVNWTLADDELEYLLVDSGAKVLVSHHSISSTAARLLGMAERTNLRLFLGVGELKGYTSYSKLIEGQPDLLPSERSAGAFLSYTSGTTGRPKGVLRNLPDTEPENIYLGSLRWRRDVLKIRLGSDNAHLCCSPLYNSGSLIWAYHALQMGHAVVLSTVWHPTIILSLVQKYRITTTTMVPAHFVRLLGLSESERRRYDITSLTHVVHGSAPCPIDIKRRMIEWLGPILYETYSSTEIGMTLATSEQWLKYPGTVGLPGKMHHVKILDHNKQELPIGSTGLVYLRIRPGGDFRYKGDDGKTAGMRYGEYATAGDIGYLNEEGYLFLCDRASETIIVNGMNVYPAELEGALAGHPLVADCVATSSPNDDAGEDVRLFVQLATGVPRTPQSAAEILTALQRRVARYKCPREIEFIDRVPRDEAGKLFRRRLRSRLWEGRDRAI